MSEHSKTIIGSVANKIKTLSIIRNYINCEVSLLIYKTLILPLFEYAVLIHGLMLEAQRGKNQRLQTRALKITFSKDGNLGSSALHQKARIMELDQPADMQLLSDV